MHKSNFGKSQMNMQAEMFCLKRELTMTLDENHSLKVKIRRLENEIKKKDKYINYLQVNAQKNLDLKRRNYENTLTNFKKRNDELCDLLVKKNWEDEKRNHSSKSLQSYKQSDNKPKKLLKRTSSSINSEAASRTDSEIDYSHRLKSHSDSNTQFRDPFAHTNISKDYLKSMYVPRNEVQEYLDMISILKDQHDIDRNIIETRNSEIFRLSAELDEIKSQLMVERKLRCDTPEFPDDSEDKTAGSQDASPRGSSSPCRETQISGASIDLKKKPLEPVEELNESEIAEHSVKSNTSAISFLNDQHHDQKTKIEYEFDSEVSSDEDVYIINSST